MEPLSPALLAIWAALALISVLGLSGCIRNPNSEPVTYYQQPVYRAPASTTCIISGNFVFC